MQEYLFLVSIGPVQDFIASARRSRDLHFGSWLLSELAKAVAKEITDLNGENSLIFPAPHNLSLLEPGSELNVANKIFARISGSPQELGKQVQTAITQRLHALKSEAYEKFSGKILEAEAARQIDELIEYFWVAVPFKENSYDTVRKHSENLMAARKNTRNFGKVVWENNRAQLKSSIDGQLESVIPGDKYPHPRETGTSKSEKAKLLYIQYGVGPAEHLSGVDLLKRHGVAQPVAYFPSTSHMATKPFLERLNKLSSDKIEEAKRLWTVYIEHAKQLTPDHKLDFIHERDTLHKILDRIEGSFLFEDRLVDLLDFVEDRPPLESAKKALREFYKFIDEQLGKARPDPYYAILHADGDYMGQTIDRLAAQEKGDEQHRKLSQALDGFAGKVREIVEQHQGALVYAGGDDVLAFLPLHTALQCASKLAKEFQNELEPFKSEEGQQPTLSVGIAVVHHLHSLSSALDIARAAEKTAKNIPGKNALAITIRKRSGGQYTAEGSWGDLDRDLELLITLHCKDAIPGGTAYELQDMLLRLSGSDEDQNNLSLNRVIQADTVRILQRKLNLLGKGSEEEKETLKTLRSMLGIALPLNQEQEEQLTQQERDTIKGMPQQVKQFINKLLTAQVFADARKLAKL